MSLEKIAARELPSQTRDGIQMLKAIGLAVSLFVILYYVIDLPGLWLAYITIPFANSLADRHWWLMGSLGIAAIAIPTSALEEGKMPNGDQDPLFIGPATLGGGGHLGSFGKYFIPLGVVLDTIFFMAGIIGWRRYRCGKELLLRLAKLTKVQTKSLAIHITLFVISCVLIAWNDTIQYVGWVILFIMGVRQKGFFRSTVIFLLVATIINALVWEQFVMVFASASPLLYTATMFFLAATAGVISNLVAGKRLQNSVLAPAVLALVGTLLLIVAYEGALSQETLAMILTMVGGTCIVGPFIGQTLGFLTIKNVYFRGVYVFGCFIYLILLGWHLNIFTTSMEELLIFFFLKPNNNE